MLQCHCWKDGSSDNYVLAVKLLCACGPPVGKGIPVQSTWVSVLPRDLAGHEYVYFKEGATIENGQKAQSGHPPKACDYTSDQNFLEESSVLLTFRDWNHIWRHVLGTCALRCLYGSIGNKTSLWWLHFLSTDIRKEQYLPCGAKRDAVLPFLKPYTVSSTFGFELQKDRYFCLWAKKTACHASFTWWLHFTKAVFLLDFFLWHLKALQWTLPSPRHHCELVGRKTLTSFKPEERSATCPESHGDWWLRRPAWAVS